MGWFLLPLGILVLLIRWVLPYLGFQLAEPYWGIVPYLFPLALTTAMFTTYFRARNRGISKQAASNFALANTFSLRGVAFPDEKQKE